MRSGGNKVGGPLSGALTAGSHLEMVGNLPKKVNKEETNKKKTFNNLYLVPNESIVEERSSLRGTQWA